jgi:organic hydroperoxide reductase OsmC/OhrA
MTTFTAEVRWVRGDQEFTDHRYSRKHIWRFDGGIEVPASSSAHVVPTPYSSLEAVDPEEAFVASLSSCHMLWFLSIAAKNGFVVDSYSDEAIGLLEKNASGRLAITKVTLRPRVQFSGVRSPDSSEIAGMHHTAHSECFIANSVLAQVVCEPVCESG